MEEVFLASENELREIPSFAGGCAVVFSRRSPVKETANEDAAAVLDLNDETGVLMVADGVGGERAGAAASRAAVEALCESIRQADGDEAGLRNAIMTGIEEANQRILQMGIGAMTTLALAEIHEGVVRTFHVGDSWIIVVGQRGKIKRQVIAHSPVGMAIEAGVLDAREAMHHEDRHLVSNVVGTPEMRIEVGAPLRLAPRDTLVLASDGLTDNLYPEEIIEICRKGRLLAAVQKLAELALQRMNQPQPNLPSKADDLTIVAFRLNRKSSARVVKDTT